MVSKPVGMMDLYLHDINRMWIYVKRYATRISAKGDWSALLCTRVHMYMHLTLLFVTVCVCVCGPACACMWYLGVCRRGPLRRSMLTREAAGPPDVPIPTRLVTSGPLLLSLQYTHTHTHTHTQDFFSRLYIVHARQHRRESYFMLLPL